MAVEIHPIKLMGNWDVGYALDQHVLSSDFLGEDPFGGPVFDNKYSEIGELLKNYKYRGRRDLLPEIVSTIILFLQEHPEMADFETIIPVPPSKPREYQPTLEICESLAESLRKYFLSDILVKESEVESKNLSVEEKRLLYGTIHQNKFAKRRHSVLLVDDLYKTGTTLNECVRVLRGDPLIDKIFVLAITKTKNTN